MTKLQELLNGHHSNINFIAPYPDYFIAHSGTKGVMVECPEYHDDIDVLEWIRKEKGGSWIMAIWNVTSNGVEETLPNPHQNSHGLWVYLVRRA